ncbi:carbohydrate binding domain-containing protein [Mesorhizobium sp. A556]
MPLFTPQFRAGINKVDTSLQNEGGYSDSNHVRFYRKMPQVVGGWQIAVTAQFEGKARGCHSWRTLEGKRAFAFGTNEKLYSLIGGALRDITPDLHNTVLTDAFTTVDTSNIVTVYLDFHRLEAGDTFTFSNHQSSVGGLVFDGDYTVDEVLTEARFTFDAGLPATSTVTTPGGGNIDFVAALPVGLEDNPLTGYGSGTYGDGPYGSSGESITELRVWNLDNWGEYLLANPSGYGIFEYEPEVQYLDLAYNGDFDTDAGGWALGTGWTWGTAKVSKTAGTASNLSQDVDGVLEGGRYYKVKFDVTLTAGTLKFRMNAGLTPAVIDVGTASAAISKVGTFTVERIFLCPADAVDVVFEGDATFAGSIDTVSYQLLDKAYRIITAPPRVDAMFVDPRGVVVALGTTQVDGQYSATAVRCSDIGNNRSWVPDTSSIASEFTLRGGGGKLVAGLATRQQNLVWGDEGVFSLQWLGNPGEAFKADLLGTSCGLISRHAMCEQNGFVMWMANTKQFFMFRGMGATSLGVPEILPCAVREEVFDNLDDNQLAKIHAGINSAFSEAWFFFPDARDGSECSRVAVVSWTEGSDDGVPWVLHQMARTAWEGQGVLTNPYGLTTDGLIMEHEQGYTANGQALNEYLETSDFDIEDGTNLLFLSGIMPDFKGQTGNIQFKVTTRNYPNGPQIEKLAGVSTPTTLKVNFRAMARQAKLRLTGQTSGAFWRLGAIRLEIAKSGAKR